MKIYLIVATVAAFAATPSHAETFNGPFVGIDVGYDNAEFDSRWAEDGTYFDGYGTYTYKIRERVNGQSANGLSGGVFVGYDTIVNGKFFAGVELRAALSSAKLENLYTEDYKYVDATNPQYNFSDSETSKYVARAKESFSGTARVGYLLNESTGAYLRGGIVHSRFKISDTDGIYVGENANGGSIYVDSAKDKDTGIVYGAGLETKLSSKASLRVEYNVAQYGNVFSKINKAGLDEGESFKTNVNIHQVRLGLSYGF